MENRLVKSKDWILFDVWNEEIAQVSLRLKMEEDEVLLMLTETLLKRLIRHGGGDTKLGYKTPAGGEATIEISINDKLWEEVNYAGH